LRHFPGYIVEFFHDHLNRYVQRYIVTISITR